jgi:hypothetical protein
MTKSEQQFFVFEGAGQRMLKKPQYDKEMNIKKSFAGTVKVFCRNRTKDAET